MDDPARGRTLSTDDASPIPAGLDATLVLLRHGESQFIVEGRFQGQANTPLSEAGRRQAELAGARLARPHESPTLPVPVGQPLEIVHSPLARAAQTAEAVAGAMARPDGFAARVALRPDPGFLEIGQGAWEGLHGSEIEQRYGAELGAWRREVLCHVVRPGDGTTAAELDDADPAQVEQPLPESIERQVEQRQQDDLEDAVVGDQDRPRVVRRRVPVAGHLRAVQGPRYAGRGEALEERRQCRSDACLDLGE